MLTCFPDKYKGSGHVLKTRLQLTADPMPNSKDAERVTGGIVNIKRALLDPAANWLDRGNGYERLTSVHWCKDTFRLSDPDSGEEMPSASAKRTGSIIRFHKSLSGMLQWQIADADWLSAKVRWSGPRAWKDNDEPVLAVKTADGPSEIESLVRGPDIYSFVPNARFDKIAVAPCPLP
jgi:hypothetical protein